MKADVNRLPRRSAHRAVLRLALCGALAALAASPTAPQQTPTATISPALARTTTRRETRRVGDNSSLTVYGAPEGSISIEAWPRGEVDVTADIELRAQTEEELTLLAGVNGFLFDAAPDRVQIVTTGTHDPKFMKRVAPDFPDRLLTAPWKIDYRIRLPAFADLEVYAGRGALNIAGVEGTLRLNAGESAATLQLAGGDVTATIARGPLNVRVVAPSWRGRGTDVRLASGDLTIELPANFTGDINAKVLRTGSIENAHPALAPRAQSSPPTKLSQSLRAGPGGPPLSFTVGDGTLRIKQEGRAQ